MAERFLLTLNHEGFDYQVEVSDLETANLLLNDSDAASQYIEKVFFTRQSAEDMEADTQIGCARASEAQINSTVVNPNTASLSSSTLIWATRRQTGRDLEATVLMLSSRESMSSLFNDRKTRKVKLWNDVAKVLEENCFNLGEKGGERFRQKFANLQKAYLLYIRHQKTTGSERNDELPPFFDELHSILDPCLYILRFASRLEFGPKTQQVTNTALRLVQRMKRDSIHSGRRPSGLCGAALLIASRLHEFSRSIGDVIKVVKVHESTMRKRLIEFGDTPSSALTLEEFMTVDLEEEQDPPSFKAARKKDKERLQKLIEEEADNITDLQKQIELQLEQARSKVGETIASKLKHISTSTIENSESETFINESTLGAIHKLIEESVDEPVQSTRGLGPDIASIGLPSSMDDTTNAIQPINDGINFDLTFDDIDDEELDSYIMTDRECETKSVLWHEINAEYLKKQKEKEEQIKKEREEGKPEKKRRKPAKRRHIGPVTSAGEAIEKIIQEKKISSKINYEVLKSLNTAPVQNETILDEDLTATTSDSRKRRLSVTAEIIEEPKSKKTIKGRKLVDIGLPFLDNPPLPSKKEVKEERPLKEETITKGDTASEEEDVDDYFDEEPTKESESANEIGVLEMLKQHHEGEAGGDQYGYDEYGYEEDY